MQWCPWVFDWFSSKKFHRRTLSRIDQKRKEKQRKSPVSSPKENIDPILYSFVVPMSTLSRFNWIEAAPGCFRSVRSRVVMLTSWLAWKCARCYSVSVSSISLPLDNVYWKWMSARVQSYFLLCFHTSTDNFPIRVRQRLATNVLSEWQMSDPLGNTAKPCVQTNTVTHSDTCLVNNSPSTFILKRVSDDVSVGSSIVRAHLSKIKGKKSIRGKDIGISKWRAKHCRSTDQDRDCSSEKICRCQGEKEREAGVAFTSSRNYNWWISTLRDREESRAEKSTRTIKSTFAFCSRKRQCLTRQSLTADVHTFVWFI